MAELLKILWMIEQSAQLSQRDATTDLALSCAALTYVAGLD